MTPGKSLLLIFLTVLALIVLTLLFVPHEIEITCSMYHGAPLNKWWSANSWKFPNISLEQFTTYPFPDGLIQSDAKFLETKPEQIRLGDVLVYNSSTNLGVMAHRVIRIWEADDQLYFATIGDNAPEQFAYEVQITSEQVLGIMVPRLFPSFSTLVFNPCRDS